MDIITSFGNSDYIDTAEAFQKLIKPYLDSNIPSARTKYKTYEELCRENNVSVDKCVYHINSGGYAMVYKYGYFIAKIIPHKDMKNGYLIPIRFISDIHEIRITDFVACPYTVASEVDVSAFLKLVQKIIELIAISVAYIEKKDIKSKSIYTDVSLKTFFTTNRNYPPVISKAIQQVFKSKTPLCLFNNFYNLASFHDSLNLSRLSTMIYFPVALCSANKFSGSDYSMQMFFQVFLSYYVLQSHYNERFVHKDLKLDNILVFEDPSPMMITVMINNIPKKYMIESIYKFKINDFDLSNIQTESSNEWFIDLHFFVHSVIHYHNFDLPDSIKEFCLTPVCTSECTTQNRWSVKYDGRVYVTLEEFGKFIINTFESFENDF